MRKQLLGSVIVALLLLVGCKPPATFGGVPRSKIYRSVISLSPSTTELVSLIGLTLQGRTKACNYPPQFSTVPVVADLKPNYELIATKKPNLILLDRDLYGAPEIEKLKETGATIKVVGSDTVEGLIKDIYELGEMLAGESNLNDYVIKIRKNVEAAQGDHPKHPVTAVMVIPDGTGHHMVAGSKSFQSDIVRISGATLLGPDSNKFEMLNPEWLISQNPDWIIIAGETKTFMSDPRFSNLKALKTERIFGLDQDICLRRGARVDKFIFSVHKMIMLGEEKNK